MDINDSTDDSLIMQLFKNRMNSTKTIKCQNCSELTLSCLFCYDCQGVICDNCIDNHNHKVIHSKLITELLDKELFVCPLYCGFNEANVFAISTHLLTCKAKLAYERYLVCKHISNSIQNQFKLLHDEDNSSDNDLMDITTEVKCFGCNSKYRDKDEFMNHLSVCSGIKEYTPMNSQSINAYKLEMIENGDILLKGNIENRLGEYFINCEYNISKLKQLSNEYENNCNSNNMSRSGLLNDLFI